MAYAGQWRGIWIIGNGGAGVDPFGGGGVREGRRQRTSADGLVSRQPELAGRDLLMKVEHTDLPGVLILHPKVHQDDRGFFLERYHRRRYARLPGLDLDFVQDNHSRSKRGVLRGLHFQERHPQGKLVSVLAGRVWDVAVDINAQSPTFRRWVGVQLSAENHRQFYIPPGYAHGFCVLSEQADLLYKCTDFHHADDERGLLWSDPDLAIDWPVREPILSPRDAANPNLQGYLRNSRSAAARPG